MAKMTPPLEEQARMIAEKDSDPAYAPPPMFLRGNVGPFRVDVPLSSMTVALNLVDMFDKDARKRKAVCVLDLWATDGSWTESSWRVLKHSESSGGTHKKPAV